jgi:hypothetical protein
VNARSTSDPPDDLPTLVGMLQQASVLEHALSCQYLYAAFTLKTGGEAGMTASAAALTQQWHQQITKIAIQEMYHLMLASNLLTAVGSTPYFERPNFPQPNTRFSDIDLPSLLAAFDLETATRFMCWEKPDKDGWWTAPCKACAEQAQARVGLTDAADVPTYDSIGALYGLIEAALQAHPEWIDPANASKQVTSEVIPFSPKVAPITCFEDAKRYIDIIVTEGEGGGDYESMSHFAYFHQIVVENSPPNTAIAASWPTVDNPVYDPGNVTPGANLVDDPAVQPVGVAFNDLYLAFVRMLARLFIGQDETPAERQALANTVTALMPLVVKPLGTLLTRLPAGAQYPGRYAGPSFELPASIELPVGTRAETVADLRAELVAFTERLQVLSIQLTGLPPGCNDQLATIAARAETLLPMMDAPVAGVAS